jgi:hypothetical protein
MTKQQEYEIPVYRNYPGIQYGTATVKATSRKQAEQMACSMDDEVDFLWEEPEPLANLGDGECGDVQIGKD